MKKYLFLLVLIAAIVLLGCPTNGPDPNSNPNPVGPTADTGTPDPQDTLLPTPVPTLVKAVIEDFESYTVPQPPTLGKITGFGCQTSCSTHTGVIVDSLIGNTRYLTLMYDVFGIANSQGKNCTGYTWVQINYTPPANGTLTFTYYQQGNNSGTTPEYTLVFWKNFTGNIATEPPVNYDWSNNTSTSGLFQTASIPLTSGTTYKLMWRAGKTTTGKYEDAILIDNVIFEY
jgi:hypothetical protein